MLKHILPRVPQHTLYTEAFAGGAALFFAKQPSEIEVINDLNMELINFYRVATTRFEELKAKIDLLLHSRAAHKHAGYVYANPQFFGEVERAWAVYTTSKMSFASHFGGSFGFDKKVSRHPKKLFYAKEAFNLSLKERLECVTIEMDDALKVIVRYDTEGAFHFIDPPYVGSNMGHYSGMFNDQNLKELLELCERLKGKFMLTMYPNDVIEAFSTRNGWTIHRVERRITACKADSRRQQEEWMVCNY